MHIKKDFKFVDEDSTCQQHLIHLIAHIKTEAWRKTSLLQCEENLFCLTDFIYNISKFKDYSPNIPFMKEESQGASVCGGL